MNDGPAADILHYYKNELSYLRKEGAVFAGRYPKVAASLGMHGTESLDPHTERLIESVAFLAARVHRDLDQEMPHMASALLESVCPSLLQPLPSMTVVRLDLDPDQGKATAGQRIPQHTSFYAQTSNHEKCRFRTAWETTLWPIRVVDLQSPGDGSLRLVIRCNSGVDFGKLSINVLRFHLHGDWVETMPLYELLTSSIAAVEIHAPGSMPRHLGDAAWREVGYEREELVLAPPDHAYLPYVLIQEYFAFPRKFHFFDLLLPDGVLGTGNEVEIVFRMSAGRWRIPRVNASHLLLGCVPAANLFRKVSEPIVVDQKQYEYRLIADVQRETTTEIHAIESVIAQDPAKDRTVPLSGFLAGGDGVMDGDSPSGAMFWSARRALSHREDIDGTEMFLSFVDAAKHPCLPVEPVIHANLLCTNRRLAEQVPQGAKMTMESIAQDVRIQCLYDLSSACTPPIGSTSLWRLVSLLTLNYESLLDERSGVDHLRALIHLGIEGWRGYCRGTDLILEFDDAAFVGSSPLLLAAVLTRFLAMYTSVNSFVRVSVRREEGIWKRWEPMSGRQRLL